VKFFNIETKAAPGEPTGRSKALPSRPAAGIPKPYTMYAKGWDTDRVMRDAYDRVIWVHRAVSAIASHAAELPLIQRRDNEDQGDVVDTGDPLLWLLNVRANSHENGAQFRHRCVAQGLISRDGVYIEILRDAKGQPAALEIFPAGQVEPVRNARNELTALVMKDSNGAPMKVNARYPDGSLRIAWFHVPHPTDPWLSDTPFESAGISIELDFLSRSFNQHFLQNDARPGGILNVQGHMDEDEVEELRRRFAGGPQAAGHTTVLSADDVKYQDTSYSPRDSQYVETRRDTKEDILLALGVPESVLGNASGRTFTNADVEREVFWTETMRPILRAWARFWDSLTIGADDDDLFVTHDTRGVAELRRSNEQLESRHQLEFLRGTTTLNEYRAKLGREPIDHPLARTFFIQRGFVIPSNAEDAAWLEANGYLGLDAQTVDPVLDAENETPTNVTAGNIESEEVQASLRGAGIEAKMIFPFPTDD